MGKRQFYPMTTGTLFSVIDYPKLIEMSAMNPVERIEYPQENNRNKKNYMPKTFVKKKIQPRRRGI